MIVAVVLSRINKLIRVSKSLLVIIVNPRRDRTYMLDRFCKILQVQPVSSRISFSTPGLYGVDELLSIREYLSRDTNLSYHLNLEENYITPALVV